MIDFIEGEVYELSEGVLYLCLGEVLFELNEEESALMIEKLEAGTVH